MVRLNKNSLIVLSGITLALFLLIAISNHPFGFWTNIDLLTNLSVMHIQYSPFIEIAKGIGIVFDTIPLTLLSLAIAGFLWFKKIKKEAVGFAVASMFNALAIYSLKALMDSPRPINALIQESSRAFPSGHAATAVLFFGFLMFISSKYLQNINLKKVLWVLFPTIILIIGFSRIYLNVHWARDIFGGFLLGTFTLLILIGLLEKENYFPIPPHTA